MRQSRAWVICRATAAYHCHASKLSKSISAVASVATLSESFYVFLVQVAAVLVANTTSIKESTKGSVQGWGQVGNKYSRNPTQNKSDQLTRSPIIE